VRTAAGNTPLILAAKSGLTDIVRRLLKRGARPDTRNNLGFNALMIACQEGHEDIVRALLSAGADRSLRNKKRETAVDVAAASGHPEIAQLGQRQSIMSRYHYTDILWCRTFRALFYEHKTIFRAIHRGH
jgi:hypothetical protein